MEGVRYKDILGQTLEEQHENHWAQVEEIDIEESDIVVQQGNSGPTIELSLAFKDKLHKPWEKSVVVKLLGRSVGYHALCVCLNMLWLLTKAYRVIDLENDFFLIQFPEKRDYLNALIGGLWIMLSHYLTVQP